MEDSSIHFDTLTAATRFPSSIPTIAIRRGPAQAIARRLVLGKLAQIEEGEIEFVDGHERNVFGRRTSDFDVRVRIDIHHPSLYPQMAFGGSVGAGEAYMSGAWSTDDLTNVVRVFVRNRDVLNGMEKGLARLLQPAHWLYHRLRANTPSGSKKNIAAHYDLGNDFYGLFLDETMMYSAGIFERETSTLRDASIAKIDRLCRKLDLKPTDHLLEIGTGWGGFAVHAATHYGCRVTTTTISKRQFEYAEERVRRAGLSDRVRVLFQDYRELTGTYDKLVSVEMIEAVGHAFYDEFFSRCSRLLNPDGLMAMQAITIADQYYEQALRNVDFIQRYVFPGSTIPSMAAISTSVARASDLRIVHHEDLTPHYARTLASWRQRFHANLDRVSDLGYDERFVRMWEFYLCYCEGGFAERAIQSVQTVFAKPRNRSAPLLPALN